MFCLCGKANWFVVILIEALIHLQLFLTGQGVEMETLVCQEVEYRCKWLKKESVLSIYSEIWRGKLYERFLRSFCFSIFVSKLDRGTVTSTNVFVRYCCY